MLYVKWNFCFNGLLGRQVVGSCVIYCILAGVFYNIVRAGVSFIILRTSVSYITAQAWARMALTHLGLGMRNGHAYAQLWGLGIQNLIANFQEWEWEWKIKFPTMGMKNGNENLIPIIWELKIAEHFQKKSIAIGNSKRPFPR